MAKIVIQDGIVQSVVIVGDVDTDALPQGAVVVEGPDDTKPGDTWDGGAFRSSPEASA